MWLTARMAAYHRLGELQLAILHVLWQRQEATVTQVQAALRPTRDRALTTIATMLVKMEQRGIVTHRTAGRQFIYRPALAEPDVRRSMVADLTDRLFAGDPAALVSHLLTQEQIEPAELARLRALILEKEREADARHEP